MGRTRLTVDEIILSVETYLRQIAKRTHSDELILQLIRSKTANQFTEEDIKNLRNKYHKVLELNRLEEVMDTICSIKKSDRSDIENDIVEYSGYEYPFFQTDERRKIALKMLRNYNRRVPDLIKQKAHNEIKNSLIRCSLPKILLSSNISSMELYLSLQKFTVLLLFHSLGRPIASLYSNVSDIVPKSSMKSS